MKKKRSLKSMRTAIGMAIATLLTTCLIGGTFAKYTTSATSTDLARVAYWGFEESGSIGINYLFSDTYTNVASEDGADVIAPGTSGQASFSFEYNDNMTIQAPEVAYTFTVSVTESCSSDIKNNPNIQFKLDDGSFGTWDELVAAIKALSGQASGTKNYAAGELPAAFTSASYIHTIYWQWLFTDATAPAAQDAMDTAMANQSSLPECSLSITVSAVQVD